jgi:hypothetical protein
MVPPKPVSLRTSIHIRFHETGKGFLILSLGGGASQFLSAAGQTPGQKHYQCIAMAESGMSQNARPSKQSGVTKIAMPHIVQLSMWGMAILNSSSSFVEKNVKFDRLLVYYS